MGSAQPGADHVRGRAIRPSGQLVDPRDGPERTATIFPKPENYGSRRPAGQAEGASASTAQRRARPGPLSWFSFILVALVLAAGAVWFTGRPADQVPVLVAKEDIPAFHRLTAADLTLALRDKDNKDPYAGLPVEGRLTLNAVKKDAALRQGDVAPDIAAVMGNDFVLRGFTVAPASVLGGSLAPGNRIQLLLMRDGRRLASLTAIVVKVSDDARSLTVALRQRDANQQATAIGAGTAEVLRAPTAADAPA